MAIYLVQHGKSLSREQDPEKGLSGKGEEEVRLIAGVAKNYNIQVDTIFHSGKKRARQTADIVSELLQSSQVIEERAGIKPMDDVTPIAAELSSETNSMLVGHLPFMERLVSQILTGKPDHQIFKFQNGGIVCMDQDDESGAWYIKWALMPNIT